MSEPEPFDKEAVYDAEIAPLMTKIIEVCKRERIPFVAVFQYAGSDAAPEGAAHCTSFLEASATPSLSAHMRELRDLASRRVRHDRGGHVAFAETVTTSPDGKRTISIRRVL